MPATNEATNDGGRRIRREPQTICSRLCAADRRGRVLLRAVVTAGRGAGDAGPAERADRPGLCGSPADHIRLLHDADATRQAILDGLAWLAGQAAADGDATAVVYFSGHGWLDEAGVGARRCALAAAGLCRGCAPQRCL